FYLLTSRVLCLARFADFVPELCDAAGVASVARAAVVLLPAVFVSLLFASAVVMLADDFAGEYFFVEAVAAELFRAPDLAAVPREPVGFPVFVPFAVDRVVDFFVVDAPPLALLVASLSSGSSADVFA